MTLPPLAIIRAPAPKLPILSPPIVPLLFQVDPGPVTVTVPVEPADNPMEPPPPLLTVPPFSMVSVPAPKPPTTIVSVFVHVEPAPDTLAVPCEPRNWQINPPKSVTIPLFWTASVPTPLSPTTRFWVIGTPALISSVPLLTASVPPLMVVPPKVAPPESVRVPVPTLTSELSRIPEITPLTSVDMLLPPTVSSLAPNWNKPAPAIEPALSLRSPAGPVLDEKSVTAPLALVMAALPPVLLFSKSTWLLLVMVALPAVLLSKNILWLLVMVALAAPAVLKKNILLLLVMVALPAVLLPVKSTEPKLPLLMVALPAVLAKLKLRFSAFMMEALPPLIMMPAPSKLSD
jgi:hypothetical protein